MLEALLLGLFASTAGAILAALVAAVVNAAAIGVPVSVQLFLMSDHLTLDAQPGILIGAIVSLSIVTSIATVFPSFRAARLRPIEAMSHFG
jgi:ABC-type lipoprotein release transport system permease subunit